MGFLRFMATGRIIKSPTTKMVALCRKLGVRPASSYEETSKRIDTKIQVLKDEETFAKQEKAAEWLIEAQTKRKNELEAITRTKRSAIKSRLFGRFK